MLTSLFFSHYLIQKTHRIAPSYGRHKDRSPEDGPPSKRSAEVSDSRSPPPRPSMSISSILNDDNDAPVRRSGDKAANGTPAARVVPSSSAAANGSRSRTTSSSTAPVPADTGRNANAGVWPPPIRSVEFDNLSSIQQAAILHAQGRRKTNSYDTDAAYDAAYDADADVLDSGRARAIARIEANPELFDPKRDEAIRQRLIEREAAAGVADKADRQRRESSGKGKAPVKPSMHETSSVSPAPTASRCESAAPAPAPAPASDRKSRSSLANGRKRNSAVARDEADYTPSRSGGSKRRQAASVSEGTSAQASSSAAALGTPAEAPKKRKFKLIKRDANDSDLETDDNVPLWAPALEAYREECYKRRDALDTAYGLLEDVQDERVVKTIARGYMLRYDTILAEDARQEAENRKREELELKKQQKRQERAERERQERKKRNESERAAERQRKAVEAQLEEELLELSGPHAPKKAATKSKKKRPAVADEGATPTPQPEDFDETDDEMPLADRYPGQEPLPPPIKKSKKGKKKQETPSALDDSLLGDQMDFDGSMQPSSQAVSRAQSPEPSEVGTGPEYTESGHVVIDARRERALEDAHRKIWAVIAKKDVPKVYRTVQMSYANKTTYWRRISQVVQREARRAVSRNTKGVKDVQLRARKIMREMLVFWRRNEKEERELRKKAEKEAVERAKKEEEMREAKRQARKLNFLITQTELYSHFVGNKLKTSEAEDSAETAGSNKIIDPNTPGDVPSVVPPISATPQIDADGNLKEIDFDDEDESNLRAHAMRNAEDAVNAARAKAQAFDQTAAEERKRNEALAAGALANGDASGGKRIEEKDLGKAFDSDDMNFNNPTSMGQMDLKQPKMLTAQLKEYQLKGLNWLANLYEQGINGILADEMGLGKTVQSISLMAYLAEVHDIWGPFLVIAPASTLHNWQQEITRFVPTLKALPYWGNVKDRAVLRKFWSKKQMAYNRDAPFHVLITSYQLVVSDEKYFNRVKWQYMVLDEAQAIKSSSSNRWKTLLGFNCRNRLLLTGTPVQNSMQELWALLHFIMPSLFDSHDEFSEWFSKDIESHAENKGTLNEHQLRRLHMILKPFMLRRIKKNVQNELGDKVRSDLSIVGHDACSPSLICRSRSTCTAT